MGTLSKIKVLCEQNDIRISKLEKECGFSNASLAGLKNEDVSFSRVAIVAKYFNIPLEYFLDDSDPSDYFVTSDEEQDIITAFRKKDPITQDNIRLLLGVERKKDIESTAITA